MTTVAQILDEDNPDAEGSYVGSELHAFTCPCEPCAAESTRLQRMRTEWQVEVSDDERYESLEAFNAECQERIDARAWAEGVEVWHKWRDAAEREYLHLDDPDYPDLLASMNGDDEDASKVALTEYASRLASRRADDEEQQRDADADATNFCLDLKARASFKHTLPLVPGTASEIRPILTRSDGRTLLYEARLNSIFGEPGLAKSWIALMMCIEASRAGARTIWWDWEDHPSTIVTRLKALGAEDLIASDSFLYATPDLVEDEQEMATMARWMSRGTRPGVVVIDSVESAGLPTDSNDAAPWYKKHTEPFERAGAGVVTLDHVPKRKLDRPRGPIGSTHKTARLSGAGLFLSGTPWTKDAPGKIYLANHKDRPGDLPAPLMKTVAVVEVSHGEGGLLNWSINPPDDDDDDIGELTGNLLDAIVAKGQAGVKGSMGVRGLVKAKGHKVIDSALADLMANGLVDRRREGHPFVYFATETGMDMSSDDDESEG